MCCEALFDYHVNLQKYNRTHSGWSMNATIIEPIDHTFTFETEIQIWGDGGWKRNFIHFKQNDACHAVTVIVGSVWNELLTAAGVNQSCPLQPGFYHFENRSIDFSKIPILIQPGKFKIIVKLSKRKIIYTCIEVEFLIQKRYTVKH